MANLLPIYYLSYDIIGAISYGQYGMGEFQALLLHHLAILLSSKMSLGILEDQFLDNRLSTSKNDVRSFF